MLLTTGNKSEMAVGYATIYGDMNGGFNPIKDLLQDGGLQARRLAQFARARRHASARNGDVIPTVDHRQGAEGRAAAQPDRPGSRCRPIRSSTRSSTGLVEDELSVGRDRRAGQGRFDRALVKRIEQLLLHRRVQAPPVGAGREADQARPSASGANIPITNGYRDESEVGAARAAPAGQAGRRSDHRPLRPVAHRAACISAMPRPALAQLARSRMRARGGTLRRCASTTPIARALAREEFARGIEDDLGLARRHAGAEGRGSPIAPRSTTRRATS